MVALDNIFIVASFWRYLAAALMQCFVCFCMAVFLKMRVFVFLKFVFL